MLYVLPLRLEVTTVKHEYSHSEKYNVIRILKVSEYTFKDNFQHQMWSRRRAEVQTVKHQSEEER